ncbi:SprB repeat-containing protein [Cytophaga aurantiaca]|uniref:SprB repeat-containing protein n=1 Tax=Cytophaga aurantiaca TaxID=29530 RepID=UPI000367C110|nr:SprB repeat-containing protein [Cytophaga aurantiaca]
MRTDLEQYYLIDQYLENKLKGDELSAFENQLMQDETFAQEVAEQRMLNGFILEAELKNVRTQIEKDLSNIQNPSFFRMNWKWIGVGLVSLSAILYYVLPDKDVVNPSIQESTVHSNENKTQPVIAASGEVDKAIHQTQSNNTNQNSQTPNAISATEVSKTKDVITATDNIQATEHKEVIIPTVSELINTNHTSLIETKPTEVSKTIDCSVIKISASITTGTSCSNTETGSIHIDKISGGIAPYVFTLNNKKIKEKNISDLGAGTYEVKVSDKNGCSTEYIATVLEKNCTPSLQQGVKFNINPTIGETCSIPFDADKKGNVTIYSRSGKIIYRASNPSADHVEWSGTDGYGVLAEAGLYVYIIEYTDGTKVTGEVNIIR